MSAAMLARAMVAARMLVFLARERASYHAANIVCKHLPKVWATHGLKMNRHWLVRANALRAIEFESWQAGPSQFPQPGWWRRGRLDEMSHAPKKAALINACLADPKLKWESLDPRAIEDIQNMLSHKALQACQNDLSAFAASHVFEKIPRHCQSYRNYFREKLSELDPNWHMRESTGNLATFLRANDPDYSAEIQRLRQEQQAHIERQQLESAAPEPLPARSRTHKSRL